MFLLDTNIILRYIIGDGGQLFERATDIFKKLRVSEIQAELPIYIITEIVFVLEKYYSVPTDIIIHHLEKIFDIPWVIVPEQQQIIQALHIYFSEKIDLADALLVAFAKVYDREILSFDKKLNKLAWNKNIPST